jgi:hypothetical protein
LSYEGKPLMKFYLDFLVEDKIDDKEWLTMLIKITSDELPELKFKKQNK